MNESRETQTEWSKATVRYGGQETLTVVEVAKWLRVPKSTVYKMAKKGQLPAFKVGKHWRVPMHELEVWIHDRSTGRLTGGTSLTHPAVGEGGRSR
jgi:excisionase family DNA binding protein